MARRKGIRMSNGHFLRFYVRDNHRHRHVPLWEWLLNQANQMGIRGGSAFHAMGGFGRHHHIHEQRFFELGGSIAVEVEFIVTETESRQLLDLIEREKIRVFYARIPAQFGILNPDRMDVAEPAPRSA